MKDAIQKNIKEKLRDSDSRLLAQPSMFHHDINKYQKIINTIFVCNFLKNNSITKHVKNVLNE